MLKEQRLKKSYRSDRDDIASDFLNPMLRAASSYDRAVGYFTSGMLLHILPGLQKLADQGGAIRLIASPDLSDEDVNAIDRGYSDRKVAVVNSLERVIDEVLCNAEAGDVLAGLISSRLMDVRIAVARRRGVYHEKIGIFKDTCGDAVAFTGSLNETMAALTINFESIDVFTSWDDPDRVSQKCADFEKLWDNRTNNLDVIHFPEFLTRRIAERLASIAQRRCVLEDNGEIGSDKSAAAVRLRSYQADAVERWTESGYVGILDMATGSGKTITAVHAALHSIAAGMRTVVVLAPLKHLVQQWSESLKELTDWQIIICHSEVDWRTKAKSAILRASANQRTIVCLVSTYATAMSADFLDLSAKFPEKRLIIADEVHNVTSDMLPIVLPSTFQFRLGLSATPARYLDPVGTSLLQEYFSGTVYQYSLRDAITEGTLTPYIYLPVFCYLTSQEQIEYDRILNDLGSIDRSDGSETAARSDASKIALYAKRDSLLQHAIDKVYKFQAAFSNSDVARIGHALIYCHAELIDVTMRYVGVARGVAAHTFTARESMNERQQILHRFAEGQLKALVAIRCLDEGVDVPSIRTAFFLNSSANPKEFIQRRGRVLRRADGKARATIYDFVVLPQRAGSREDVLLKKELARFEEFASLAENRQDALQKLEAEWRRLGVMPL